MSRPSSERRRLPARTCIGCREAGPPGELVRLVVMTPGDQVVPAGRRFSGRGAWLHPRVECAQKAFKTRAFGRAFRRSVAVPPVEELLAAMQASTSRAS